MLDAEARGLVEAHLPTAATYARCFRRPGIDDDDLEQAALLGLCQAAKTFDPNGAPFHVYARHRMRDRVFEVLDCPTGGGLPFEPADPASENVHLERAAADLWHALESLSERDRSLVTSRFGLGGARQRPVCELAKESGLTARRVRELLSSARSTIRSELERMGWQAPKLKFVARVMRTA
jgi:RNA polymerase sigma factor (sigma-70 family)